MGGCGSPDPPPWKCHILSFKTGVLWLQVSQHQGWIVRHYHFTNLAYADDATILFLISSKQTVSSNQCLCCSTGLKLSRPKTKLQNVGVGDPLSTILVDHGSYAVLPTIDRLQLGSGRISWGLRSWLRWKYVRGVRVCFDPPPSFKTVVV